VNVDDLYSTSTFGRILGEQLMSELAMRGFDVIELRHSDALQFLNNEGEFALSREMGAVKRERKLGGILVGTYVVSPDRVYLNSRLLDPSTSMILSAASAEMSKTPEIVKLARAGGFPGTLERIPVKHLGLSTFPMNMNPGYVQQQWAQEEAGSPGIAQMPNPRFGGKPGR
jgi:TolB-like protein